jgi:hypothetical protein
VRKNISIREDQEAALAALGGSAWIRAQIDAAEAIARRHGAKLEAVGMGSALATL